MFAEDSRCRCLGIDRRRTRLICALTIQAVRAAGYCDTTEADAGRSYHRREIWKIPALLPQRLRDFERVSIICELDFKFYVKFD